MGMLEDDLSQFPPSYEVERKVHLYFDQQGARIPGTQRLFADTLCKLNSRHDDMRVTTNPAEVTCKICRKDGRFQARLRELSPTVEDTVRVVRILEYVGPRSSVERVLQQNAVKGFRDFGVVTIREAMLPYPEKLG